jgi:transcription termination factor NusB
MNKMKEFELEQKRQEKRDKRIRGLMPHLFTESRSDEQLAELREFFFEQERWLKSSIESNVPRPYMYYYEKMEERVKEEKNKEKKEKMENCLKKIKKNAEEIISKIKKERESTYYELEFVLWRYYKHEWENFPSESDVFSNFIKDSYITAFPKKEVVSSRVE